MKITKLILGAIILLTGIQTASAKDGNSFGIEFGGIGSEKKYTHSATISGSTAYFPYTQTTFNPDLRLRLDLPATDISDTCFFNVNLDYDLSWQAYNSSDIDLFQSWSEISNLFTFLPELVFIKDDFRFFFGTGLTFGINSFNSEEKTTSTTINEEFTEYSFLWNFEIGAKYFISEHLSIIADLTFSMPFMILQRDGKLSSQESGRASTGSDFADKNTHGNTSMQFSPRVGVSYMF